MTMLPAPVDLDTLQDRRVVFQDHNMQEMYMYILPNLNSAQETSTEAYADNEEPPNINSQSDVLSTTLECSNGADAKSGNLLLNIFDDSYADLIKRESDPGDNLKSEPHVKNVVVSVETKPIFGSLENVCSLRDHSPMCQLWLALEQEHGETAKDLSLSISACCKPTDTELHVAMDNLHVVSNTTNILDQPPEELSMDLPTDPITGTLHVVMPELQVATATSTASQPVPELDCTDRATSVHHNAELHVVTPELHVETTDSVNTPLTDTQTELHAETELQVVPVNIDLPLQQPATYSASKDTAADTQELLNPPMLPVVPLPLVHELLNEPNTQPVLESSPKHDSSRIYYEVLAPDDSEVLHINHEDIIKRKPFVPLDKLSQHDIDKVNSSQSSSQLNYDGNTKDYDHSPYISPSQKRKRSTYRPQRRPSKQRMAAQNTITTNRSKKASVHKNTSTFEKTVEKGDSPSASSWNESDYEPLQQKKVCALKVTTHCIRKFKPKRNYICPGCDKNFPKMASLNHHFRTTHDPIPCKKCGKRFFMPSSLHHHKYEHREKEIKCGYLWTGIFMGFTTSRPHEDSP